MIHDIDISCKSYIHEIFQDHTNLENFQRTRGFPRKTFGETRETNRIIITGI